MAGESDDFDKLLQAVADGESVDWDALERAAPNDEALALIRELRLISEVAEVHRSQVDDGTPADIAPTQLITDAGSSRRQPPHVARPNPELPEGESWGNLVLVRKVGEGAYGEVYQAHDKWLDHAVALKLFKPEVESRVQPADLLHEARKLARVRHPNVVTIHGADRHNGRVGFWMDFIDGDTLSVRVAKGRLSSGEATSVGLEVCRALAAVHRANIVHRDVKAQNVMRAHDGGRIILMDFGAGEFMGDSLGSRAQGTPLYLAPEIFRGEGASPRSDIYAAGVLLYHLVTGQFPVEGGSPRALAEAHERGVRRRLRDERPDLPEGFIAIVERAIDPDPARRYPSAGEMEAKLNGEKTDRIDVRRRAVEGVEAVPPKSETSWFDYARRAVAVVAVLAAATMAFGFIASRAFQIILRVDPDFALGMGGIFNVGIQAMIPFILYGTFGAAVLGGLGGLRRALSRLISTRWRRMLSFTEAWDPVVTAAGLLLVSVVSWVVINNVVFAGLFGALYTLMDDPTTSADLSILGSAGHDMHLDHFYVSLYLSMLLGVAVWRWFPALERRTTARSAVRGLKWAIVAIAFMLLAFVVVPRRITWERYPVVKFDNGSGLVIGSVGDEILVYTPEEPGRPRRRTRPEDLPGFHRTAETRFLFDRERQTP